MPAYARRLFEARARGEAFWLVIVAAGWLRDSETLRGDKGIARIGCPADVDPAKLDWRAVVGMDVLCTRYTSISDSRYWDTLAAIWQARPATVWVHAPGGCATRLMKWNLSGERGFAAWMPADVPLDAGLRGAIERTREHALVVADRPLFDDARFDAPRQAVLDRWTA